MLLIGNMDVTFCVVARRSTQNSEEERSCTQYLRVKRCKVFSEIQVDCRETHVALVRMFAPTGQFHVSGFKSTGGESR